jgi:tRNA pseudouridine(38-40) synthase
MDPDWSFIADREWQSVARAMRSAVNSDLPALPGDERVWAPPQLPAEPAPPAPRAPRQRTTWACAVSYHGQAFHGFAWQEGYRTVQGCLEGAIAPLCGKHPLILSCAGRTDAGVSAIGQVVSFYTWAPIELEQLRAAVDGAAPGELRLLSARKVPRAFHASFSAQWRRYVYLLPLYPRVPSAASSAEERPRMSERESAGESETDACEGETGREGERATERGAWTADVCVEALDAQLRALVGTERDYRALGRGLPASKSTRATLLAASARRVLLGGGADEEGGGRGGVEAVRVELVGDRFIRRQVRTLISTAILTATREGAEPLALLERACGGKPEETPLPAPAVGLCFAEAEYAPFVSL